MADSDNLYSRVLRELYSPAWLRKSGRESYVELATKLGIDDQTVRSIIARMQESGFLKGWSITLNPRILGMHCASFLVRTPGEVLASKDKIISQLELVEGVVAIFSFLGDVGFRLVSFYQDEADLERRMQLIASICGQTRALATWKIPFPPSSKNLKKTDWQIIKFLSSKSRKNVSEIANEVGISARTVRRRLDMMTENNCFFLSPVMDVKKVEGFLYHCVILFDDKKAKAVTDSVLRKSIERVVFVDSSAEFYSAVSTICRNISEAQQFLKWLQTQNGVHQVTAGALEDVIFVRDWIDQEIEKRLRA
jgi:DNA-binding Lrp family transcriptional regulator